MFEKGFTEINTNVNIQPISNLQISFAHRYLNNNPFFDNSSLYVVGGYYRIDDNWGVGFSEQYEGTTGVLEQQRYSIYRDLTSWVASVGAIIRDNGGVKEYGLLLTFTLKALPKFSFDLNFDPAGIRANPIAGVRDCNLGALPLSSRATDDQSRSISSWTFPS